MSVFQHSFEHTWTLLNGKNTPLRCQCSITNSNIDEYFSFTFSFWIRLSLGQLHFYFVNIEMGNEQILELDQLRILLLPACLTFLPGPFACGMFISETWEPHLKFRTVVCLPYTSSCCSYFVPLTDFWKPRRDEVLDRESHLKMQPVSKSASF